MGTGLRRIIFSILLLQMCAQDMESSLRHDHQHPTSTAMAARHISPHTDYMDQSVNIFLKINDLKAGKTMPIYFYRKDSASSTPLLSKEEADSIPFSSKQLPNLLDLFSIPKDSPQAKAVEYTIAQCEHKPVKGELHCCPTSMESMLDFAKNIFSSHDRLKVLATSFDKSSTVQLQNYTIIEKPAVEYAPKIIGCHKMPYPYAVFYCHTQESDSRLFELSLVGENGDKIKAPVICHMDTSQWDPDHIVFRLIKTKPGKSPVCHFFPENDLLWLPLP